MTWQVMFRTGPGRQNSRTFLTEKAAQQFADLVDALGGRRALLELEATHIGPTLDELAANYWPFRASRVRSERTTADYERDYENWISPHLGHLRAATIDERDVQAWIDTIRALTRADGTPRLSPKSIADKHAILHGIFKWASSPKREFVPAGHNPTNGTDLPPRGKAQPIGLRPAEWQALHAMLSTMDPDAADLALFLVSTGCRVSEATALDSHAIEDAGATMWVTIMRVWRRGKNGTQLVQDTKGGNVRRIRVDTETAAMVRRRLERVPANGLVFTTALGSRWEPSHFNTRKIVVAAQKAGLRRVTTHMLRHTHVGHLVLSGAVSLPEVQRRIGHRSIKTTIDVYGGMIEDVSEDALERLQAMRNTPPKRGEQLAGDTVDDGSPAGIQHNVG